MSASRIVYRKTAAGLAEMQARRLDLPRKTFSLLLAVDGQRSREQLCSTLSAFGDVAAQLEALEEMGLIEDRDSRAGGAFSFASPLSRRREAVPSPSSSPARSGLAGHDPRIGPPPGSAQGLVQTLVPGAGSPSGFGDGRGGESGAGGDRDDDDGPSGREGGPIAEHIDPESTTLWTVTETGQGGDTGILPGGLPDLANPPVRTGGFVELDTWPGTAIRGEQGAPVWPRTVNESSLMPGGDDPAAGVGASTGGATAPVPAAPPLPPLPAQDMPPAAPLPSSLQGAPQAAAVPAGVTSGPNPPAPAGDATGPPTGLPTIVVPAVTPLPPWSMPAPIRQPAPSQPQATSVSDRSRSYPAACNLIDIRAYIGVGRKRIDPLANVREAMSTVLTRNIDLQNYELLHAVESMQVQEEFMHLLPYYLADLDQRLSPDDFRGHVENLSRLSGMSIEALLALLVRRREAEQAQDSPKSSGSPT